VWTVPSHASLFTGMYPSGHGLKGRNLKLRSDIPTMAGYLGEQGYATVALTANALIGDPTGLSRGFQTLTDVRNIVQTDSANGWQRKVNALYRRLYYGQNPSKGSWFDSGAWRINFDMKRQIRSWRKQSAERPFFIFANYMEPHLKYDPPRAFRRRFLTPAQEKQWKQVDQNAWKYLSGQVEMTDDDWDI
ncbi:MAG: sulfatase-like hydrolase/transferase, partial [Chloroflexi bacterium]|nr:sulfatase-like hydrolase/transferase [Chloroflexota bacterium]